MGRCRSDLNECAFDLSASVRLLDRLGTALLRKPILLLSGITRAERHWLIEQISTTIGRLDGWISDHTLFSNIAINLQFVLPSDRLPELASAIEAVNVWLDQASVQTLERLMGASGGSQGEIQAAISITFVHSDPDLRREIPAVPGQAWRHLPAYEATFHCRLEGPDD